MHKSVLQVGGVHEPAPCCAWTSYSTEDHITSRPHVHACPALTMRQAPIARMASMYGALALGGRLQGRQGPGWWAGGRGGDW